MGNQKLTQAVVIFLAVIGLVSSILGIINFLIGKTLPEIIATPTVSEVTVTKLPASSPSPANVEILPLPTHTFAVIEPTSTSRPEVFAPTNTVIEPTVTSRPGAISPTSTQPIVNFATPTRPETYVQQKGEWHICIARRYNLDLNTFFAMNGLNMISRPPAGFVYQIPATGTWNPTFGSRSLKQHPATITTAPGDTLYTIACAFGDVYPGAILFANSLSSPDDIKPGMVLQIP